MTEQIDNVDTCCKDTCLQMVVAVMVVKQENVAAIVVVTDVAVIQLIAVQNKSGF